MIVVRRIEVTRHGGPEALALVERAIDEPAAGDVRVRHTAVGVNFIDVYHRTGLYRTPEPPFPLGVEAAGVVEAVGPGVESFAPGDRVAYAIGPLGAYSEARNLAATSLVKLPGEISDEVAAAMMLKGLTAQYLLRRTIEVQPGDFVLVHAAAGGVGTILCQWARHLGATVIGTVSTDEKARLAAANGCRHPVVLDRESFRDRVREVTRGAGCRVVYDSVGKDTFEGSLACLGRRGMLVSYGQSSGRPPPVDVEALRIGGSLFVTRPALGDYVASRGELLSAADELFEVVLSGAVEIEVRQRRPLTEAAKAHADLEARRTTGSTVLIP